MTEPLVRYQLAVSLDGFIAPEDGSVHWLSGDGGGEDFMIFVKQIGGIIMGRTSFEQQFEFGPWAWPQPTLVMANKPLSQTPKRVEAFAGGAADAVALLKSKMKGGDIWLFGGGKTAAHFLDAGLIDRFEPAIIPIVLGRGIPLFDGAHGAINKFKLLKSTPNDDGIVLQEYARV